MIKNFITVCLILSSIAIVAQDAQTAAEDTRKSEWNYVVEPYLMFPKMKGETQIRNLPPVEVDANVGDIFSQLKMGVMLYLEANNGSWAISSDLVYMKLAQGATSSLLVESGEVSLTETIWEVAGLKRVSSWLEVGAAARLVSMSTDINLVFQPDIIGARSASITESWVDPVIVLRAEHDFNEDWFLNVRGDLGGFGIGSDFTWQIQADVGYKFSNLFHAMIGYRQIGIDYKNGSVTDTFVYDMDTFGLVSRLRFNL